MKRWIRNLNRLNFQSGKYSQSYQDELLLEILENVETCNTPPFCVEFGFNHSELIGGTGSNVARLVLDNGWMGLLLDSHN
ncbi:MAG: hypothetical protein WCG92_24610, partial [Hyphomicrobiales bacterium]